MHVAQFPLTALREAKILQMLHHPNVVELKEIVNSSSTEDFSTAFMVLEYCENDLTGLIEDRSVKLTEVG